MFFQFLNLHRYNFNEFNNFFMNYLGLTFFFVMNQLIISFNLPTYFVYTLNSIEINLHSTFKYKDTYFNALLIV
jgi:hypothetical protein